MSKIYTVMTSDLYVMIKQ